MSTKTHVASDIADITVFTRNNCSACTATKTVLKNHGMGFSEVNVEKNVDEAIRLVDEGFRAMPVVRVIYFDGETDVWSGFKPDMIYRVKHGRDA